LFEIEIELGWRISTKSTK